MARRNAKAKYTQEERDAWRDRTGRAKEQRGQSGAENSERTGRRLVPLEIMAERENGRREKTPRGYKWPKSGKKSARKERKFVREEAWLIL
jgi:hypothetical protein